MQCNTLSKSFLTLTYPLEILERIGGESSDYQLSEESSDNESTLDHAEQGHGHSDDELAELEAGMDVPLEELIAKYVRTRDSHVTSPASEGRDEEDESEGSEVEEIEEDADVEMTTCSSAREIDNELGMFITR